MTRRHRPVVALGRHADTEVAGIGASPGARLFFTSLDEALQEHFEVVRIPPYFYSMDARGALVVAADILRAVDACVFGLPPHPVDLEAFFLLRDRLALQTPFVYMPLGEFPRGAWAYRQLASHLTPADVLLFACRTDQAIHDALVASTPARVSVVPWGVDPALFRPDPDRRNETRRHLGLDDDAVVFVSHGRLIAEKNVHGTIMTFRRLAERHPHAYLWIIGALPGESGRGPGLRPVGALTSGPLSEVFKDLLRGSAAEQRVLFWGGVSYTALPRILGAADIGINLTLYEDENFGYSAVEAMSSGLPVIGTDWGGLKDTIADGTTGFRVPTMITSAGPAFDRWTALKHATQLVENADLRLRMGAEARRRVERLFTLRRFTRDTVDQVQQALDSRLRDRPPVHQWSPLGDRLVKRYTRRLRNGASAAMSIPPSPDRFARHPMLRTLLRPYATMAQPTDPSPETVYFLISDLIAVGRTRAQSRDPLWLASTVMNVSERAIVLKLKRNGFCSYRDLRKQLADRLDERLLRVALRRLLRSGLVLQSAQIDDRGSE